MSTIGDVLMNFAGSARMHRGRRWMLLEGDCLEAMKRLRENSLDSVVTDPPYGLGEVPDMTAVLTAWLAGELYAPKGRGFMGKAWDAFIPGPEIWREVFRVLKPGGHLLTFGGSRTFDLVGLAVRLAGFEIRDTLSWMYGTGFPKSLDVAKAIDAAAGAERTVAGLKVRPDGTSRPNKSNWAPGTAGVYAQDEWTRENMSRGGNHITMAATDAARQWEGWGTALKPAWEPVIMARKPLSGTVAANVQEWGTGALNIDGCRIPTGENLNGGAYAKNGAERTDEWGKSNGFRRNQGLEFAQPSGRWPANVVLDEHAAEALDAQTGVSESKARIGRRSGKEAGSFGAFAGQAEVLMGHSDSVGASRFFYIAKASRSERDAGCGALPARSAGEATDREDGTDGLSSPRAGAGRIGGARNIHPTVKPVELMRWLIRLVTPPGGTVLDPFAGSGSTGVAALQEGFAFISCEREPQYAEIAVHRLTHAEEHGLSRSAARTEQGDLFGTG